MPDCKVILSLSKSGMALIFENEVSASHRITNTRYLKN